MIITAKTTVPMSVSNEEIMIMTTGKLTPATKTTKAKSVKCTDYFFGWCDAGSLSLQRRQNVIDVVLLLLLDKTALTDSDIFVTK